MADKTTTLKTKTGDNVYPNVIGDNRDNAIVDSAHINHTLTADHKINFRLDTNVSGLIFNSLQKPAGLTKTKLVGVGTNGQENIEIGDNLTLANGKLSATGGGSGGDAFDVLTTTDNTTYTGTISGTKLVLLDVGEQKYLTNIYGSEWAEFNTIEIDGDFVNAIQFVAYNGKLQVNSSRLQKKLYSHFITMIDSSNNVALYLTILNTSEINFTFASLESYISGKKILVNGNLHGSIPTYIVGEGISISIYYRTPGDSNINPEPDVYSNMGPFTITDLVTPVK